MYVTHCPIVIHSCAKYGMAVSKADFSVNYYHNSKPYFGMSVIDHYCSYLDFKKNWYGEPVFFTSQIFSFFHFYDFLVFAMVNFETMVMIKMTK